MSQLMMPKMAHNYTILMQGTSVPLTSRPRHTANSTIIHTVHKLVTKSDAHRKVFGHIVLIVTGLLAAGIEIAMNFTPLELTVTQFLLPAIVQEFYDFKWKL